MQVFLGGVIAIIIGIIGMIIWGKEFIDILTGTIPIMLILGGAMATYLGFDDIKEKLPWGKTDEDLSIDDDPEKFKNEAEKYKAEAEKYKAELEKTKSTDE